ncbi:unnamed protein product [Amoebophrya sp. A120]|nr:unnamed protein product [Amoebophrya sp. A120]|eukprot:GSA120T00009478001.1
MSSPYSSSQLQEQQQTPLLVQAGHNAVEGASSSRGSISLATKSEQHPRAESMTEEDATTILAAPQSHTSPEVPPGVGVSTTKRNKISFTAVVICILKANVGPGVLYLPKACARCAAGLASFGSGLNFKTGVGTEKNEERSFGDGIGVGRGTNPGDDGSNYVSQGDGTSTTRLPPFVFTGELLFVVMVFAFGLLATFCILMLLKARRKVHEEMPGRGSENATGDSAKAHPATSTHSRPPNYDEMWNFLMIDHRDIDGGHAETSEPARSSASSRPIAANPTTRDEQRYYGLLQKVLKPLVIVSICLCQFGLCVTYYIVTTNLLRSALTGLGVIRDGNTTNNDTADQSAADGSDILSFFAFIFVITTPLTFIRSVAKLAPCVVLADVSIGIGIFALVALLVRRKVAAPPQEHDELSRQDVMLLQQLKSQEVVVPILHQSEVLPHDPCQLFPATTSNSATPESPFHSEQKNSFADVFIALGTICFAFEGICCVIPTYDAMKDPERDFPLAVKTAVLITSLIFALVGTLGYSVFGDGVEDIVLLNFNEMMRDSGRVATSGRITKTSGENIRSQHSHGASSDGGLTASSAGPLHDTYTHHHVEQTVVAVIQIAYSIGILLTYPFQMLPAVQLLEEKIAFFWIGRKIQPAQEHLDGYIEVVAEGGSGEETREGSGANETAGIPAAGQENKHISRTVSSTESARRTDLTTPPPANRRTLAAPSFGTSTASVTVERRSASSFLSRASTPGEYLVVPLIGGGGQEEEMEGEIYDQSSSNASGSAASSSADIQNFAGAAATGVEDLEENPLRPPAEETNTTLERATSRLTSRSSGRAARSSSASRRKTLVEKLPKALFRTILCIFFAFTAFIFFQRFEILVSLIGSFCGVPLAFVYPVLLHWKSEKGMRSSMTVSEGAILAVGIFNFAVVSWINLEKMIDSFLR